MTALLTCIFIDLHLLAPSRGLKDLQGGKTSQVYSPLRASTLLLLKCVVIGDLRAYPFSIVAALAADPFIHSPALQSHRFPCFFPALVSVQPVGSDFLWYDPALACYKSFPR
jgi:hypothetical protein